MRLFLTLLADRHYKKANRTLVPRLLPGNQLHDKGDERTSGSWPAVGGAIEDNRFTLELQTLSRPEPKPTTDSSKHNTAALSRALGLGR